MLNSEQNVQEPIAIGCDARDDAQGTKAGPSNNFFLSPPSSGNFTS